MSDEVEELVGTVVKSERSGDSIILTYANGRVVELLGDGYDGLWQYVSVYEITPENADRPSVGVK